jgi:23S rRNA pseudouridine1911/1915/1917 synthase
MFSRVTQTVSTNLWIEVPPEASGSRLDVFLAHSLPDVSRTEVARWIREGRVQISAVAASRVRRERRHAAARPGTTIYSGDRVQVDVPARRPPSPSLVPELVALDIAYEDAHLIIVNKPSGIAVHPGAGRLTGTLVHALLGYTSALSAGSAPERPGIVHRLDKDTSGLILIARTDKVHRLLSEAIAARAVHRTYRALVWGEPRPAQHRIVAAIGRDPRHRQRMAVVPHGKPAATLYRTLYASSLASLLELDLETGRTHQIRVHMATIGHPIVGDATYGGREKALARLTSPDRAEARRLLDVISRQALHAYRLRLMHPVTGLPLDVTGAPPEDFQRAVSIVRQAPIPRRMT